MPKLTNDQLSADMLQVYGVISSAQNIPVNAIKLKLDQFELSTVTVMNSILAAQILSMEMQTKDKFAETMKVNHMKLLRELWHKYRLQVQEIEESEWMADEKKVLALIGGIDPAHKYLQGSYLETALESLEKYSKDLPQLIRKN